MLRFFRAYNKWILAVGGTLLLIAFLIPEAIQRLSQRSATMGATWASTDDGDVTGADELRLRQEMQIVGRLGDETIGIPGFSNDPVHWFLLQHEAVRAGLVGGPSDGFRSLQELEQTQPDAPPAEEMLALLAGQAQLPRAMVLETLAKLNGVRRLIALYERSPKLSDRRVRVAARQMLTSVDADLVVIDARVRAQQSDFVATEAALEEHLARFGELQPGTGDYGFGYRLPDRVRIEWLAVSAASIRGSVETSDRLSNIELRKHRERNLDLFPRSGDADDFEAVRSRVRDHLLGLLSVERTAEIAKFASDQVVLAQRGVPRDGPYLRIPADWSTRRAGFETIAQAIADQFRVELPVFRTSGPSMIEPSRIESLPDLGSVATDRVGPNPMRPAELVAQARELRGSDIYAVQTGVTLPAFRSPAGDVVLVRILDADASRAPRSVDEARDKLVEDVRALRAFEELRDKVDSLRADALRDGLVPLARQFGTSVRAVSRLREADPQFMQFGFRMTPSLPGLGQSEEAVREIVAAAMDLPVGVPVSEVADDQRTIAFGVPRRLSVVVARLTRVEPLTIEEFEPMREQGLVERTLLVEQLGSLREELFSRAALEARHGFRLLREVTPEEEDEFDPEFDDEFDFGFTDVSDAAPRR